MAKQKSKGKVSSAMKILFDISDSAVTASFTYSIFKKGVLCLETININESELEDGITIRHEIEYNQDTKTESVYEYRGRKKR